MAVATRNRKPVEKELTNGIRALAGIDSEIILCVKRKDWIKWVVRNIEPLLPEGATLSASHYQYSKGFIEIQIDEKEGRIWRGLDGTAGLIFKIRKALNIDKLTRHVDAYGDSVYNTYYGTSNVNETSVYVNIRVDGLPPSCTIEYVEEDVPASVRRVAKVKCN